LNSKEVTERDVEPLQLVFLDKAWMLTAYCRLRQDVRTFRLDRMDRITVRREEFVPREVGDRSTRPWSLSVVVRFENSAVRWVRERQHFTFTGVETADSTHTIMRYLVRSLDQIEGWLLSWGDQMTVLEPEELRKKIRETAVRLLENH
jgi:predicted DNA-binding transcriptional regulator YafY